MTPPPTSLPARALAALTRLGAGGVVVAVSGGPDSVALLHALLHGRSDKSLLPLTAAHLNHQLRGAEADADEEFVRRLCSGRVELRVGRLDVAALTEGDNLEAAARRLRYDWLAQTARECGAARVATGHTADDQAETVLHRLLRGTGLQGLRGIAPRRPLTDGVTLVRPLLEVTRAEVLAYLAEVGQEVREDSSNLDRRLTRNRIRHELLPLLAGYNPAVREVLSRLAAQAEEWYEAQRHETEALLAAAQRPAAGKVLVFDLATLAAAPRHRVRELFRLVWQRQGWALDGMGYDAWKRLESLALEGGTALDFPGRIRARRRDRVLQLGPA